MVKNVAINLQNSDHNFLYIAGTSYTGSTLLAFLLNSHPEIVSVGEATGPYSKYRDWHNFSCSCGTTLSMCSFWQQVEHGMKRRGAAFGPLQWDMRFEVGKHPWLRQILSRSFRNNLIDRLRDRFLLFLPPYKAQFHEIAHRNMCFVDAVLEVTGKKVFADATKDVIRPKYFELLTPIRPYVIHLVRDSLGFVASYIKYARHDKVSQDESLNQAIRYWNRTGSHVKRLFSLLPPQRKLRVRYEDLCTNPERELTRIAGFVKVNPIPGPYDFRSANHHIIGNQMRLETSSAVVLDERWREILSPAQIEKIRIQTHYFRQLYGYE